MSANRANLVGKRAGGTVKNRIGNVKSVSVLTQKMYSLRNQGEFQQPVNVNDGDEDHLT